MRLSLFTDFSLRVLMYAAVKSEAFSLNEVAGAYGISRNHLVKVVNHLSKLGYLETRRGRGGGIELGMKPEQIRIGLVVRRTENAPLIAECFDPKTNTCPINGICRLKSMLGEASRAFYDSLDRYTLQDLVGGAERQKLAKKLLLPPHETAPSTH